MNEQQKQGAPKARKFGGKQLALAVGMVALSGAAAASGGGVDTTPATEAFTGVETAVNTIGPVMLGAVAAGIIYKWVTAFLI